MEADRRNAESARAMGMGAALAKRWAKHGHEVIIGSRDPHRGKPHADEIAVFDAVMAAADGFSADDLYELHWHVKALGQRICTHSRALCESCPLSGSCAKRVEATLHSGYAA